VSNPVADLLLTDATVLTMAPQRSGVEPRAGVVALLGGRVLHVGPDDAGLTATRTVSLGGRCVVPGFHDAHQHMAWFGATLDEIDLSTPPIRSLDDLAAAVAAAAESTPPNRWIVGNGYDENKIGGHPDRDLLERVAPGRRVLLTHTSGHMAVVSAAVLAELGIAEQGRGVTGGTVVVDESGRPTGLLQEQAQNLLTPLRRPLRLDDVAHAPWHARARSTSGRASRVRWKPVWAGAGSGGRPSKRSPTSRPAMPGSFLCESNSWWPPTCSMRSVLTKRTTSVTGSTSAFAPDSATTGCASGR
jgi:predicted amidohydrolase YtcJ